MHTYIHSNKIRTHTYIVRKHAHIHRPYSSGAQRPARDESSCGPRCPTTKANIWEPSIDITSTEVHAFNFTKGANVINWRPFSTWRLYTHCWDTTTAITLTWPIGHCQSYKYFSNEEVQWVRFLYYSFWSFSCALWVYGHIKWVR